MRRGCQNCGHKYRQNPSKLHHYLRTSEMFVFASPRFKQIFRLPPDAPGICATADNCRRSAQSSPYFGVEIQNKLKVQGPLVSCWRYSSRDGTRYDAALIQQHLCLMGQRVPGFNPANWGNGTNRRGYAWPAGAVKWAGSLRGKPAPSVFDPVRGKPRRSGRGG